jgi:hypothetical protein
MVEGIRVRVKVWFVALCISLLLILFLAHSCLAVDEGQARSAMVEADQTIKDCYLAVAAADKAGGNISDMLSVLQDAGMLLSRADLALEKGDFDSAYNLAVQSKASLDGFIAEANSVKDAAEHNGLMDFMINIVGSSAGTVAVVVGGFALWFWLNRRYSKVRHVEQDESQRV